MTFKYSETLSLNNWFTELETLIPRIKNNPGYMKHVPLSALKFGRWVKRFQKICSQQIRRTGSLTFTDFDTETTGLVSYKKFLKGEAGVTDIGAVKIVNGEYLGNQIDDDGTQHNEELSSEFMNLMNPGCPIPREVSEVTHISNNMVRHAPSQYNVLRQFKNFSDGTILLGHNIGDNLQNKCGYDLHTVLEPIYNRYWNQNFGSLLKASVDTLPMFQGLCAGISHTNTEFAKLFGIKLVGAHRAMPDVRVHALAFSKMLPLLLKLDPDELIKWAQAKLDKKNFYLMFLRKGANYDGKHEDWIEFGIKMDKFFNVKNKRQNCIIKYDFLNNRFLYEPMTIGGITYTADEIQQAMPISVLKRQAAILKKAKNFPEAISDLTQAVVF